MATPTHVAERRPPTARPPDDGSARLLDLAAVAARLGAAMDPAQVAAVLVGEALPGLGATAGGVALLTPAGQLEPLAAFGDPQGLMTGAALRCASQAALPTAEAVRAGEPLVLVSPAAIDARYPHLAATRRRTGDGAWAAVPLIAAGRAVGVLALAFASPLCPGPAERAALAVLAQCAASALERARLAGTEGEVQATAEAASKRLRAIQYVLEAALGRPNLDDLLRDLTRRVREVLGTDTATVLLLSDDRRELCVRASSGLEDEVAAHVAVPLGQGIAGRIAATCEPLIVPDLAHEEVHSQILRARVRSLMGAPLTVTDRVVGVLHTGTVQPRDFSLDDLWLLSLAASRVASAIEAAKLGREREVLLGQVQQHAAEREAALAAMPAALVTFAAGGEILRLNPAAERLLGAAPGGTPAARLEALDGRVLREAELPWARALRGETVRGALVVVRGPERATWVSVTAAPIAAAGAPAGESGAVATLTDVTALHDLEEQREDLLRAISHDLRTPLTLILLKAQLLGRDPQDLAAVRDEADDIATAAWRMDRMIEELVESSRLEAGDVQLRPRPLGLRTFLADVLAHTAAQIDPAVVDVVAAADLPPVDADPGLLERALVNLLVSARRHTPDGGRITVRLERRGPTVVTAVTDGGPGLPPEELGRLFERYYRTRAALTPAGLGLGLFIARMLVERHGGRIWAESPPGHGCTVAFSLPAAAAPVAVIAEERAHGRSGG
ncbi:MAG TPA: GAF domain-containing sensor histidine kinase [Polyangia bacterium]|jgi:signal transduction histidine kinase